MSRMPEDRLIGRDMTVFRETASTNLLVEQRAMHGEAEGWVVFAELAAFDQKVVDNGFELPKAVVFTAFQRNTVFVLYWKSTFVC